MAHVINIAVQTALKTLKAEPAENPNQYRLSESCARLPPHPETNIIHVLEKLRRHIYVFTTKKGWALRLQRQTKAAGLAFRALMLDMPTHDMLNSALLRGPITAFCASQPLNSSMRSIALTNDDWK